MQDRATTAKANHTQLSELCEVIISKATEDKNALDRARCAFSFIDRLPAVWPVTETRTEGLGRCHVSLSSCTIERSPNLSCCAETSTHLAGVQGVRKLRYFPSPSDLLSALGTI